MGSSASASWGATSHHRAHSLTLLIPWTRSGARPNISRSTPIPIRNFHQTPSAHTGPRETVLKFRKQKGRELTLQIPSCRRAANGPA